ncbi:ABC transporter permease [Nesterenkonia populi]
MPARLRFILIRTASLIGLLWVLATVMFILQEISGQDPVAATIGATASPEAIAAARERFGLDDPMLVRYVSFLGGLLVGDLGLSFRTRRPVMEDLMAYMPATLELVLFGFVLALILGVVFAVSSMLRWPGASVFRGILFVGSTIPTFLVGILGLIIFYRNFGLFPSRGRGSSPDGPTGFYTVDALVTGQFDLLTEALHHMVMPAVALALAPALAIGRVLRSSLMETYGQDYIRTADAKGMRGTSVLFRHVLRNSVNAALSMGALQLGFMLGGVLVVEEVFSWGGMGSYLGASLNVADFPAVAGVTLVLGAVYVVANTAADILQSMADPRIAVS